jgi:hypothetical protein
VLREQIVRPFHWRTNRKRSNCNIIEPRHIMLLY